MKLLAIETSCDDASVAIVTDEPDSDVIPDANTIRDPESRNSEMHGSRVKPGMTTPARILAERTASQVELGKKYGGVFPELAAREHFATLLPTIEETLLAYAPGADPRETLKRLDAIAVTAGPGLIGSLLVGVTVAQALAMGLGKKLIPVNHLSGHIYSTWLEDAEVVRSEKREARSETEDTLTSNFSPLTPTFPVLALTVSGGHTHLVWMEGPSKFEVLGRTRDDAAGEAFDKVSVMLGLGYPGGPAISAAAAEWNGQGERPDIPRPMINEGLEFSFSGLKTAVRYWLGKHPETSKEAMAYEVQEAITDILVTKLLRAAEERKPHSLILAGGVAANARLREKLIEKLSIINYQSPIRLHISSRQHSTDNGAMIGAAALAMLENGFEPVDPATVEARSSWPLNNW